MLQQLTINNFAIVSHTDVELKSGMTTITGETGAGKSIAIDALGLCLGDRADASAVRPGAKKSDISARFGLTKNAAVHEWLEQHDLDADDNECIIRRVISAEGRSRSYINGQPVPLQQLKQLAPMLVSIHGQHAHQTLLKSDQQRLLLDRFAGHHSKLDTVAASYQLWKKLGKQIHTLQESQLQRESRRQLLQYQVDELDQFALEEGEYEQIEQDHKRLFNGQSLLDGANNAAHLLSEDEQVNACQLVRQVLNQVIELSETDQKLAPVVSLLNDAQIQLEEASHELNAYSESIELDPSQLQQLDERLSAALQLARKHQVNPNHLPQQHKELVEELAELTGADDQLEALQQEQQIAWQEYCDESDVLHQLRLTAAAQLSEQVTLAIRELNMPKGLFSVECVSLKNDKAAVHGRDEIQFLVSTNPGQQPQPLSKVASGGELSRISLALQVLTSNQQATPTLIFDEVDVGISGQTAAIVGKLLRKLGEECQVMCVTHLPQVAACGHQQLNVAKFSDDEMTDTNIHWLADDQRINELARMLGGDTITEHTRANAQELLLTA
ncbi:DNA repair protein RecN [Corallincola luteus]|uniref:DNA repair protein RecN n=2 Tax=Corallincola TaxID=1775176 RepID=A0A368NDQ9_9GAMM|nr:MULTISPECIES: DNA repair protein RecN [Corallincola]RCU48767.1 DNA repair protein RecN [Corallincola holothuriorum]TCI01685.1 DNA repair protein RecN [Corallincola luteus]